MITRMEFEFWYKDLDQALCAVICGRTDEAVKLLEAVKTGLKQSARTENTNTVAALAALTNDLNFAVRYVQEKNTAQAERYVERALGRVDILGIATHGSY